MKQILLACLLTAAALAVAAQEPVRSFDAADSLRRRPAADPLAVDPFTFAPAHSAGENAHRLAPEALQRVRVEPLAPMSSVAILRAEGRPARVVVLGDNTLRLGRRLVLSNGQAPNWGPYPDALLDARTLSLPGQ